MLAWGLVGSPGVGLGPGRPDIRGPPALALRGPSCTPSMSPPSLGTTPVTRSTSMVLLIGRPWLPRALPPVTGRREDVTGVA